MNIVVTGSLGNIGRPLSMALVKSGHSVEVISSTDKRAIEIQQIGATSLIGSLDDDEFLSSSFAGKDAVFCMVPPSYTQPDQIAYYRRLGEKYKKAILKTGIKRVVYLSSYGAHLPYGTGFITGAYHVEQILNSVPDIYLTHLRPTYFYYNLLAFIPLIKAVGNIGAVYGDTDRLPMVSPQDIAEAAAEELVKTQNICAVRYICSDDRNCNEIAAVIGHAVGNPDLKWVRLPKDLVLNSLLENGLSNEHAANLVELSEAIHNGTLHEDYDRHTPRMGKVKLEEYAIEFASVFATT